MPPLLNWNSKSLLQENDINIIFSKCNHAIKHLILDTLLHVKAAGYLIEGRLP